MMAPEKAETIHIPVLLGEVIAHLGIVSGGTYVDGTLGLGDIQKQA